MSRYKGEDGRIATSLSGDIQLETAKNLIINSTEYSRRLSMSNGR